MKKDLPNTRDPPPLSILHALADTVAHQESALLLVQTWRTHSRSH